MKKLVRFQTNARAHRGAKEVMEHACPTAAYLLTIDKVQGFEAPSMVAALLLIVGMTLLREEHS
jgi:hypothetical protein